MTASLIGQARPDQRPASRRRRESSEGRLGPCHKQQPTATISPNRPTTSAVRGRPHWEAVPAAVHTPRDTNRGLPRFTIMAFTLGQGWVGEERSDRILTWH